MGGGAQEGSNLFSILVNVVFGFVAGLMVFIGAPEVLAYGTELAKKLFMLSGYEAQMAAFGLATTAAPYFVLAPIGGLVIRQLGSVNSLKGFLYFALAVGAGFAIAFFSQGYFAALIVP